MGVEVFVGVKVGVVGSVFVGEGVGVNGIHTEPQGSNCTGTIVTAPEILCGVEIAQTTS